MLPVVLDLHDVHSDCDERLSLLQAFARIILGQGEHDRAVGRWNVENVLWIVAECRWEVETSASSIIRSTALLSVVGPLGEDDLLIVALGEREDAGVEELAQ